MKSYTMVFSLLIGLYGCEQAPAPINASAETAPVAAAASPTESARLRAWLDEKYEQALQFSPLTLTTLGRKERYGEIDDMREEAEIEQEQWRADSVKELRARFVYDALNPDMQLAYDLWVNAAEMEQLMAPFRHHRYFFNQMYGPQSRLVVMLTNYHAVRSEQDMRDYIQRVEGIAQAVGQLQARAEKSSLMGIRPPRFAYDGVIQETRKLIDGSPIVESDTPVAVWTDGAAKIEALLSDGIIEETQAVELKNALETALIEHFAPAYRELIKFMTHDREKTSEVPQGVSALPDGAAFYQASLQFNTTLPLTAETVHQTGLDEVARLRSEMIALKDQVGFEGTLAEFFTFTRTDDRFFFPNTDEGRQQYIDQSSAFFDRITSQYPDYFGLTPKADLIVKRVEAFREQDGAAQHYYPGTPDGSRPGVYYAHLSDMTAMPRTTMEAIAYHEGIPGHHMQISIARELQDVPEFQKQYRSVSYSEGWALYAELLAKEMGGYQDPYSDFGRLTSEMWRAIRLVVDTGLHSQGWSEAQANAYFKENAPIPDETIASEIRRYLVMPGQATAYKTGAMTILSLRERAKASQGDAFDIRDFHDVILGRGALPLSIMERRVMQWLDNPSPAAG